MSEKMNVSVLLYYSEHRGNVDLNMDTIYCTHALRLQCTESVSRHVKFRIIIKADI